MPLVSFCLVDGIQSFSMKKKKKKKERKGNSSTWANYFLRNFASKRPDKSFDTNSEATTGKI